MAHTFLTDMTLEHPLNSVDTENQSFQYHTLNRKKQNGIPKHPIPKNLLPRLGMNYAQ